jgi:hypothetical protein
MNFIDWVYTVSMRFKPALTVLTVVMLTAISSLVVSGLASNQASKPEGVYVGTLGSNEVVFKLEKPDYGDVSGMYYYRNFSRDILLTGILHDSSLYMNERGLYGGDTKAELELVPKKNGFLDGTWTDVKTGKALALKLRPVNASDLNAKHTHVAQMEARATVRVPALHGSADG